ELVTGIDLAAWQIRIAAGEALDFGQDDIQFKGHAVEARINAEDPTEDFRPVPGTLSKFSFDLDAGPGKLRLDTHLKDGETVPPH
ncbi:MAG TPA: hypothetical protein EYP98_08300, partial [Planctomycetes bacterium]|nr:hypothetical protein [Planctomycetota bacterium]